MVTSSSDGLREQHVRGAHDAEQDARTYRPESYSLDAMGDSSE